MDGGRRREQGVANGREEKPLTLLRHVHGAPGVLWVLIVYPPVNLSSLKAVHYLTHP